MIELLHFYISEGHNFFGHHGRAPSQFPMRELESIHCVAGRGIEGDRFFNYKNGYKGQITFFAHEVHEMLCEQFQITGRPPSVFRRNVITRGCDLTSLVGHEFELQGIRFLGMEECKPCYWMDSAFCPGAEDVLRGRGGLRAQILTSGILRVSRQTPRWQALTPQCSAA